MRKQIQYISIVLASILTFGGCGGGDNISSTEDQAGNSSSVPIITLQGDKKIYLTLGENYQDQGATAFDNEDGDLSQNIKTSSTLDLNQAGSYEITYEVTDQDGHKASLVRKVYIQGFITSPQSRAGISINEILTANTNTNIDMDFRQFSDWIELYNNSNSDMNIGGYYLSDDETNPTKWKIPNGTIIRKNSYQLIWSDGEDTQLHTNFSLSSSGGTVILSDISGQKIDQIIYEDQKSDISCSKINDHIYYTKPTPESANKNAYGELWKSKKPHFGQIGGFYTGAQNITLNQENGASIYYTTDGSIPTTNSHLYTQPIAINTTTIIRARALENNRFISSTVNQTYLIDEDITLPVVSIGIDNNYLYDDKIGIYTVGTDDNGNEYPEDHVHPNYSQNWIRPASVEYIKDNKTQFSENIGLKIFGHFTRTYPQKSLAIYVKDKYGPKSIKYPLFRDKPYIKSIKSFALRMSGNDWGYTMMKDGFVNTLVKDTMDIDYQAYQPAIVFINGKYWGIQNIREKTNEDYLEANHGVDSKNVDILVHGNNVDISEGTDTDYNNLLDYIRVNDLVDDNAYKYATSKIDVTEYINYMITEIFIGNRDWPYNNVKFWKEKEINAKWRWILYDTDQSFISPNDNWLEYTLTEINNQSNNPLWSTELFRNLMRNSEFKNKFISRFCTHLNTTFKKERMDNIITKLKDTIKPEIGRHFDKWPRRNAEDWETGVWGSIAEMYTFSRLRSDIVRTHIQNQFGLNGNINLTVSTPPEQGSISIDDVPLNSTFTGTYFTNMHVTLKATPKLGYKFVKWSNGSTDNPMNITLNSNVTVSAVFKTTPVPQIVINEFNYKSSDDFETGDWIELYNNDTVDIDISGWELKDSNDISSFIIPENTILSPGSFIIISQNNSNFHTLLPNIQSIGDFTFGLNKTEDSIRLFNQQGSLIDSVHYDSTWPNAATSGNSIALTDPDSDNALSSNWKLSNGYGTPGERN